MPCYIRQGRSSHGYRSAFTRECNLPQQMLVIGSCSSSMFCVCMLVLIFTTNCLLQLLALTEQAGSVSGVLQTWSTNAVHLLSPLFIMDHAVAM